MSSYLTYCTYEMNAQQLVSNAPDLRKVAIEAINDRFSRGTYHGTSVIIDMTTGYINATHLVAQVPNSKGKPKQFRAWLQTESSVKIRETLAQYLSDQDLSARILADTLLTEVGTGPNNIRGTYAHPRLICHIAQWADVKFAIKVGIIMDQQAIRAVEEAKNREIAAKDSTIRQLQEEVRQLIEYSKNTNETVHIVKEANDKLLSAVNTIQDTNTELLQANRQLNTTLTEVKESNTVLQTEVRSISDRLDEAIKRRVPPESTSGLTQIVVLIRKPGTNIYTMRRCQKRSLRASVAKAKAGGFTEIRYQAIDPNPVNTVNRIKEQLPPDIGRVIGTYELEINDTNEFLQFIIDLDEERKV